MSLEGLRAWIGEVERKLGKRTRVFLVLAVIAVGLGGAAIYLAIDARESSVSEADVQALQERLEARIDEVATSAPASITPSEAEEVIKPKPETKTAPAPEPESGNGAKSGGVSSSKVQKLLEEAARKNAEAEAKQQAGK